MKERNLITLMIKKIIALTMALLLSLFAVACSSQDTDVPEDMQSATLAGEPFRLFVPQSWILNTSGGISGAYPSTTRKIMVTARYHTPADSALTLAAYMDSCVTMYEKTLESFVKVEQKAAVLGGQDALRLNYTMVEDKVEMTCFQISTLYRGDVISLYGYCPKESYETMKEDFEQIVSEFVLCEKSDPQGAEVIDKHTPSGMEIASGEHYEYRMYVPRAWICHTESGASEAYYPESGKSNVSVTSYVPQSFTSIPDYFAGCEADYTATLPAYKRLSEAQRTVDGLSAYTYTYSTTVDGVEFRIMQTLFYYSDAVYSFTYTALADNFDLHMEDVEAMLNAFTFR